MFAWHKEDMDLFSINYLHSGKPKCWYGVLPCDSEKLEEQAKILFPGAYQECAEFMRHKTYMMHPLLLKAKNISMHRYFNY